MPGGRRLRERLDDQLHALQRREPRDGKQIRLVVLHAIRALGRRRVQHLGGDAAERLEPFLHGRRDHEQPRDVARQQIAIGGPDSAPPHVLLDPALPRQRPAERVPLVVVLAHRMQQPADVARMPDGVAGVSQRDDLVDRPIVVRPADVGQPGRQIGRRLPAEPVLRRDHQVGLVPAVAQRRDQRPRDDQVAAFDKWRARRDDGQCAHGNNCGVTFTPR